jgi:short-subunit dehydrogenase
MNGPRLATYGASKSAAWALTNGLRIELAQQGTQVVGFCHSAALSCAWPQARRLPRASAQEAESKSAGWVLPCAAGKHFDDLEKRRGPVAAN